MKQTKTIIVGAGRLGGTIARKLNMIENVVIIDKNREKFGKLQDYSGFVECGDATDMALLEKCGIKDADRIIAVSDDDNVNIFLADICTTFYKVPEIIIKLQDSRKRVLVDPRVTCICPFDLFLESFDHENESEAGK